VRRKSESKLSRWIDQSSKIRKIYTVNP
jgi:hypothetical protein